MPHLILVRDWILPMHRILVEMHLILVRDLIFPMHRILVKLHSILLRDWILPGRPKWIMLSISSVRVVIRKVNRRGRAPSAAQTLIFPCETHCIT
jgi:hypothetical protein